MIFPFCSRDARGDVPAGQLSELFFKLSGDLFRQQPAVCDEDGGGQRVVLSLGQEVGGDELRAGRTVGDDEDIAGAGDHIDGDHAENLTLRLRHIGVARPRTILSTRGTDSVPYASAGNGLRSRRP